MSSNRETGIVKRFSKEKGYGFISKNSDGTDCFVHFKSINTTGFKALEQGQEVEFTSVQGEKGPEAKDVSIVNTGTGRMPFMGGGGSSRFNFGGSTSSRFQSGKQDSTSTEKSFDTGLTGSTTENLFSSRRTRFDNDQNREIGSVKRWTIERGFGFIRRSNGGPDLFCHIRSLKDGRQTLEEGQTVEYRIQKTDKGDEARDVTIVDEEAGQQEAPSPINSSERHIGTVKRWLPEKGYGFLRRNNDGSDVFVHLRSLTDGIMSLEEGQTVEFNIKNSEKGEMAENVTVRNEL